MNKCRTALREKQEASEFATKEFVRVKRQKLENERAKPGAERREAKDEKQLDRERCNRASAAASRAKIVFYSKELEKRTDRLEMERNKETERADRATKKLKVLQEEVRCMKKALRDLWEMKNPGTVSYLVDSGVLFFLSSRQEHCDAISGDSNIESGECDNDMPRPLDTDKSPAHHHRPMPIHMQIPSPNSEATRVDRPSMLPSMDQKGLYSSPRKSSSTLRNLIHPSNINPTMRTTFSPCISPTGGM